MNNYQPVIGLEIHVELKTQSKMFCGCKNDPFHAPKPNIFTCPVCLGLPGALPVPNKKAIEWTIILGLALGCKIPLLSKFDRKNYFYPDLPKGYQISQYDQPLARNGWLEIDPNVILAIRRPAERPGSVLGSDSGHPPAIASEALRAGARMTDKKRIRINRVHLEEDTGKLLHTTVNAEKVTLIDFNRSGVPLVEIVTEPDISSSEEAKIFLKKIHQIIRYLDISDANMEEGSMRLEPNISVRELRTQNLELRTLQRKNNISSSSEGMHQTVRPEVEKLPPYKVEVKNINSFNFVKKAIDYEVARQIEILERGQMPIQENRGWDEKKGVTLPQRSKEEAHDYRYFSEPDIPPMRWSLQFIDKLKQQLPELPEFKLQRLIENYKLPYQDAERLVETREVAEYFEESWQLAVRRGQYKRLTSKIVANWLLNKKIDIEKIKPGDLLKQIVSSTVRVAVDVKELEAIIQKVLAENPKPEADYKAGKKGVIMFLVGMVMKELRGKGNPQEVRQLLEKELEN